jgi:hypothetical protein
MPAAVKRIHTFDLEVPCEVFVGTKWEEKRGRRLSLRVPVDERLEKRALLDLGSRDDWLREQAVRALRYFKSDENITRVKKLLNDPGWAYRNYAEQNHGIEARFYRVREEAYRTLNTWGVGVEQPLVEEKIEKLDEVTLEDLSHQRVTPADLRGLTRFKNLTQMYLIHSEFTDKSFQELARLEELEGFDAGRNSHPGPGFEATRRVEASQVSRPGRHTSYRSRSQGAGRLQKPQRAGPERYQGDRRGNCRAAETSPRAGD